MSEEIDRYVERLTAELRKRGAVERRFVEETRGHLADAAEDAEHEAVERYGNARTVAAPFAAEKYRTLHWVLLGAAVALGWAIAWVDARPHWDDVGSRQGCCCCRRGSWGCWGRGGRGSGRWELGCGSRCGWWCMRRRWGMCWEGW